ncbi:uncharacterized protein CC84DRAFT_1213631 [Paraphaeosphaeria sporulosa]|uniref:Uncharacterized protein n=1 Tax=Paraphaeosphaeria sporulosa TaxID=1460663 RepID=A0A177CTG8_9PLEO|nr:uncharacterized protein CC84DRAFT_1213631 [Paraphaeosphaeria sporulosa]OAG10288.1 hypothetical protein CC84DRAFT_1213631 [Paraphaeosphaeria sporulosa]
MPSTKVTLLMLAAIVAGADPFMVTSTTILPASVVSSDAAIVQAPASSNTSSVQPTTAPSASSGATSSQSATISGTKGAAAPSNVPFGAVFGLGLPVVLGML